MQFEQVIAELRKHGDKRAVAARHKLGLKTDNYLGVELNKILSIAGKIGKNHKIAEQLRKTGIRDAALLSFFVDDPKKISVAEANIIVRSLDYPDMSDAFSKVVINTPHIFDLVDEWKDSSKEMIKRAAYMSVHGLAGNNHKIEDDYFLEFLSRIEREFGYSKNWVKDSMIHALNSISMRNGSLKNRAACVIKNIGKFKVEYQKSSGIIPARLIEIENGGN
ncbi:MAG: DNA alkylation repair protein [Melioribacteraceae bacterium]